MRCESCDGRGFVLRGLPPDTDDCRYCDGTGDDAYGTPLDECHFCGGPKGEDFHEDDGCRTCRGAA